MKKILAIINPTAGVKKKVDFTTILKDTLPESNFDLEIVFTKYAGHAKELVTTGIKQGKDLFIAIGGDGTVHEIAQNLIGTTSSLAIIPTGSGNGLARHLKLPLNPQKAIEKIRVWNPTRIDTGIFNKYPFLVTAGIGLEAEVAKKFKASEKRGFLTYASLAYKTFSSFNPFKCSKLNRPVINITIANSNQWGNNSLIAPYASLKDGKLDTCLVEPMSIIRAFWNFILMVNGKINNSSKYHYSQSEIYHEKFESPLPMQIDGEFIGYHTTVEASINPQSLTVLV